jgi:hypothetical protein
VMVMIMVTTTMTTMRQQRRWQNLRWFDDNDRDDQEWRSLTLDH